MLKFLHCADLHLDSPFHSRSAELSSARRRGQRRVFSAMIEYVRAERLPLVLIAGDLFDGACVTSDTVSFVCEAFASLPDCRFVIAPGNHDPYLPGSVYETHPFPENVFIFDRAELTSFDFPSLNTTVYGYAFVNDTLNFCPFLGKTPSDPTRVNLLCGHAEVGNPLSWHVPVSEGDIAASGFDYLAFGHIHRTDGVRSADGVPYAYSGCLLGRDFGETGRKGALAIGVSKTEFVSEFVPFAEEHYEWITADVSGVADGASLRERVAAALSENDCDEHTLLRLTLKGSVGAELRIDTQALTEEFSPSTAYLEVIDETVPLWDFERLSKDKTIVGAFFEELRPLLENGTPEERRRAAGALRFGLAALHGEDLGNIG